MQTILGSGGAIGVQLAGALRTYTDEVRLVSRNPKTVKGDEELMSADLTDAEAVEESVKGSEVAYLTVGLSYDHKVWKTTWPLIMNNVIEACSKQGVKLVFFDNNYMYDASAMPRMTEESPIHPEGKKGLVRARIARRLMTASEQGQLQALIARAADFYGPSTQNASILTELVFNPLSKGKKASWMINDETRHAFTFTPDAGWATALLGNSEEAYGQIWHLPTADDPPTGREWIELIADELNVAPRYRVYSSLMLTVGGWFNKQVRELKELDYQHDRDYIFHSDKFEDTFDLHPTPYLEGVRQTVIEDYSGD